MTMKTPLEQWYKTIHNESRAIKEKARRKGIVRHQRMSTLEQLKKETNLDWSILPAIL